MPDWSTGRGQTKSTSPTSPTLPIRGSGTRCPGRWNSIAQAGNSSRRGTTSNKKPGPSGKVGREISTLTPKKLFATEAFTTAQETPVLGEEGPAPAGSMTCGSQSRKDASVPTTLLST